MRDPSALVGVGLKMYLGWGQTQRWVAELVAQVGQHPGLRDGQVSLFVLPDHVNLVETVRQLRSTPIEVGAQDASPYEHGPHTGDIAATTLAEIGCRYLELGHAERRHEHGETDELIVRKAVTAARAGLTPLVCFGEPSQTDTTTARESCLAQLRPVLEALDRLHHDGWTGSLVIAYEPEWAIGAERPAAADYVRSVLGPIRDAVRSAGYDVRILYGGSAQPGTAGELWPIVDGPFLGRSAHDPANVQAVLDEMAERQRGRT